MRQIIHVMVLSLTLACDPGPYTEERRREVDRERADQLHSRAVALQGSRRKAERSAELHRQSARLRPAADPRAFDCYAEASQVLVAAGQLGKAREYMEEAAAYALALGDSLNAARSLAEAIRLAGAAGEAARVLELAGRLDTVTGTQAEFQGLREAVAPALLAAQQQIANATRAQAR